MYITILGGVIGWWLGIPYTHRRTDDSLIFSSIGRRFWQNGPVSSQCVRKKPTKNKFLVDFCFELTAWNPFSSDLPLPSKTLIDKRRMIVAEHVEICSCGICNCSWWTSIEQVVGFTVLVEQFSVLRLADELALNKLWDLPLPPKSLVDSIKNDSCGTCRHQNLILSFIIQVFGWLKKSFGRMVQPVNTSEKNQLKTSL